MVDVAVREGVTSLLTKGTTLLADVDAGEGAQSVSHTDRTCLQVGVGRLHPPVASSITTNVVSVSGSDVIWETIFHDALETPASQASWKQTIGTEVVLHYILTHRRCWYIQW